MKKQQQNKTKTQIVSGRQMKPSPNFYNMSDKPAIVLPKEMMTGPIFTAISLSPTYAHFTKKENMSDDKLWETYNSIPNEIKEQYDSPNTPEDVFNILKNQRRGMVKRRPVKKSIL